MSFIQTKIFNSSAIKRLFVGALVLLAPILLLSSTVSAAGEKYTYASSGTKITGTGGLLGSSDTVFTKSPFGAAYTGSAQITVGNTTCIIGLEITPGSQSTTGTISAPSYANGGATAGGSGSSTVNECSVEFAAGVSDFNKSISITGSTGDTGGPSNVAETAAQREIVVTVYSEKPVSQLPTISTTLLKSNTPNIPDSKPVSWNSAASAGSTRYANNDPGSYQICVRPSTDFSFPECQTVTKVSKQTLTVDFGSQATAYNEEGKRVNVVVNINIPGHVGLKDYGPVDVQILNVESNAVAYSGRTNINNVGADTGATPASSHLVNAIIDNVEPGTYKACVEGTELCSATFTKTANVAATARIEVPVDQSEQMVGGAQDGEDTCVVTGIGWIVCPVASFLSDITDGAYSIVESLLVFRVSNDPFSTDPAINPVYPIWDNIRNLANIVFIFAFFAVIFSQATSMGIGNYGIKKMLPRMIAAAILVNLSYYLCIFAIDLSNVIGAGLDGIIKAVPLANVPGVVNDGWDTLVSNILAGTVAGVALGVMLYAALGVVFAFLATAALAVFTALVVLAARQAFLIILIILSPLAMVAFILPNTAGLFDKWRKAFTTLLIMYPLVAILFAGTKVASEVMMLTVPQGFQLGWLIQILALGVLMIPLFGIPYIIKFSGGLIGRVAGIVNDRGKGVIDRSRNTGKGISDRRRENLAAKLAGNEWKNKDGNRTALGKAGAFVGGYKARRDFKRSSLKSDADRLQQNDIADRLQVESSSLAARSTLRGNTGRAIARARGVSIQDKAIGEEVSAAKTVIENMQFTNEQLLDLAVNGRATSMTGQELSGDFYQKAAQQQFVTTGQSARVHDILRNSHNMSREVRESLEYHIQQNYSTLKAKDHSLNHDNLKEMLINGTPITDDSLQDAAISTMSGLTKEFMAGQDTKGVKQLRLAIENNKGSAKQRQDAITVIQEMMSNPQIAGKLSADSEKEFNAILSKFGSSQQAASSPGAQAAQTIPPAATGGYTGAPNGPGGMWVPNAPRNIRQQPPQNNSGNSNTPPPPPPPSTPPSNP